MGKQAKGLYNKQGDRQMGGWKDDNVY